VVKIDDKTAGYVNRDGKLVRYATLGGWFRTRADARMSVGMFKVLQAVQAKSV
jgi:hypothetical protein